MNKNESKLLLKKTDSGDDDSPRRTNRMRMIKGLMGYETAAKERDRQKQKFGFL